ncbi:MAG TPA: ATP-dependent metallopeptidase FtsH/Yme1/Tma family protein [Saprospiraceae bacterium]|nr:ATP-dependent metallopeptidase FtsH/Yme1/Tma family protein [Saprospiraceae bacterium]
MKENKKKDKKIIPNTPKFNPMWIYGVVILLFLIISIFNYSENIAEPIGFDKLEQLAKDGDIEKVEVVNLKNANIYLKKESLDKEQNKDGRRKTFNPNTPNYVYNIGTPEVFQNDINTLNKSLPPESEIRPRYIEKTNWAAPILGWLLPLGMLVLLWMFIMRRVGGGAGATGGQIFNIGKSKATLFDKNSKVNVTFKDVAGLEEAKEEVMEVVDFLKRPKKYTALGGKIPKGVLLVGPPGTGKTLLAKAVAGEADVPFFSISGSDFVEMFVGVGASRVRDLFKQAREKAPCIIFIDEIDAIGRARGKGAMQGGNDERENTLNQLLVEMDGFSTDKGVILMAATNRPDVLDNALLRPGRFDRQIAIDLPDLNGRREIFRVHLKHIKTGDDVKADVLAEMTPGFAGAEIANVCNEAALIAARRDKKSVHMDDFNYALDKVIGGLERRSKLIAPDEKKVIAYHEAGHAICGWFLEHASPLVKVTIVPRGMNTLGYAQYLPKDEYITQMEQLQDRMCMTLGGRAAEEVFFGKISTGAQNDLDKVTKMAYSMVTIFGMNSKVGNVSYYAMQNDTMFDKPYSEKTAQMIDEEVRKMIEREYQRAIDLLQEKYSDVELLAQTLLEKESIVRADLVALIGERPFKEPKSHLNEEDVAKSDDAPEEVIG